MTSKESPFEGRVSAEWLERSVPLSVAGEKFGNPLLLERIQETREAFLAMLGYPIEGHLPPPATSVALANQTNLTQEDAEKAFELLRAFERWRRQANDSVKSGILGQGLVPIGRPQFVGADYAWIPLDVWMRLSADPKMTDVFRADNSIYWNVRVVQLVGVTTATPSKPKASSPAKIKAEFEAWVKDQEQFPTKTQAEIWAKANGYSTGIVRTLQSNGTKIGRGRPRKPKPQ